MQQASGLLTKIAASQYRLLTIEDELLIDGNIPLSDGFHSDMDLSNVVVSKRKIEQLATSGLFQSKFSADGNNASECLDLSDDCTTKDDCDCECSECVAP